MKSTLLALSAILVAGVSLSDAQLTPIPAPSYSPSPTYAPAPAQPYPNDSYISEVPPPHYVAPPVPEYAVHQVHQAHIPVEYKDLKRRHPCAVPQTVCVDTVCGPVLVDICVPPHCQPQIKHKRRKIVYDWGKYEVEIHDRKDRLVVDYDN